MKPISPVMQGFEGAEVVYGKDQPQYTPLPALHLNGGIVLTRWRLSFKERLVALFRGDIYLHVMTFGGKLQPQLLQVTRPVALQKPGEVHEPAPEPTGQETKFEPKPARPEKSRVIAPLPSDVVRFSRVRKTGDRRR